MNKKLVKHAVSFLMLLVLFTPVFVFAQEEYFPPNATLNLPNAGGETDVATLVAGIINVVLGFLGLIAVIIILIGGFKWMTASGSEDKVADAKRTITYGLIGLAIVILAYVIVRVIISFVYGIGQGPTV